MRPASTTTSRQPARKAPRHAQRPASGRLRDRLLRERISRASTTRSHRVVKNTPSNGMDATAPTVDAQQREDEALLRFWAQGWRL